MCVCVCMCVVEGVGGGLWHDRVAVGGWVSGGWVK